MNKTEQEALSKILFALFLESPKRKELLRQVNGEETERKSSQSGKPRTYKLGDNPNGNK